MGARCYTEHGSSISRTTQPGITFLSYFYDMDQLQLLQVVVCQLLPPKPCMLQYLDSALITLSSLCSQPDTGYKESSEQQRTRSFCTQAHRQQREATHTSYRFNILPARALYWGELD